MRIGLVSNFKSRGLALDATLLAEFLALYFGHECKNIQYDEEHNGYYDLLIFFERVVPEFLSMSRGSPWLFVNPEFLFEDDFGLIRKEFGKVLCKTKEAYRICSELFPDQAVYTGFIAQDKYNADVPRERRFLHVAGNSRVKGTQAVVDAWRWKHEGKGIDAQLIVVADWVEEDNLPENVTVLKNISEEDLTWLQNECVWHLQPSGTEGFSHTLHEAMSVGAEILTTDAPPMNELECNHRLMPVSSYKFHQSEIHEHSARSVYSVVQIMLQMGRLQGNYSRDCFLRRNEEFKQALTALLAAFNPEVKRIAPPRPREFPEQKRIAFLGNFEPPYSTENDLLWTFEHLGHVVHRLQENSVGLDQLLEPLEDCDMFLWVHTHSFHHISDDFMERILEWLREHGKPSVSFHLDRYWGIPEREELVGETPFWKTDFVFTADGGNDPLFKQRGVNHFWLPPGVCERDCHYGTPREEYKCDVAFVGSENYHECYKFRKEMIEFLRDRYRERFRVFNGVRGPALNDLYASAKVCAGDSIFANGKKMLDRYWSDRIPETVGRGGVLVHTAVEGMNLPGVLIHDPGDLQDMAEMIDFLLKHREQRINMRRSGMEGILKKETYTRRIERILGTVFT